MTPESLAQQVADAKKSVKRMKRYSPWMFQEWQNLKRAEDNLEKAKADLERAKAAWRAL